MSAILGDKPEDVRDRILLVPGNHDVNLRISAADLVDFDFNKQSNNIPFKETNTVRSDHVVLGLEPFRHFSQELTGDRFWRDSSTLSRVSNRFLHLGIQVLLLNSASLIDAKNPKRAGTSKEELDYITEMLHKIEYVDKPFRMLISHHGPQEVAHEVWSNQDWQRLNAWLGVNKADLYLFGHGHGYGERVLGKPSGRPGLPCVMAPTPHLGGKVRHEGDKRGFVIIELRRKDRRVQSTQAFHYEVEPGKAVLANKSDVWRRLSDD